MVGTFIVWSLMSRPVVPPAGNDSLKWVRRGVIAAAVGLDTTSTLVALRQSDVRESNKVVAGLAGKPALFVGVQAVSAVATIAAVEHLRREGHPKLAWVVTGIVAAVRGYAVAHNLRILRR